MVVTTSIRLDRILLHSRATSMSSPGMDSMIPSCVTGTPTARNMIRADTADCCCKNSTIQFKANSGMGTTKKRKQEGKKTAEKFLLQKQTGTGETHRLRGQTCRGTAGHR